MILAVFFFIKSIELKFGGFFNRAFFAPGVTV